MMTTLTTIALFALGAATIHGTGKASIKGTQLENKIAIDNAQKALKRELDSYGLGNLSAINVYNDMLNSGYITMDEYKRATKVLRNIENKSGSTLWVENQGWAELKLGKDEARELANLYNKMAEYVPSIATATANSLEYFSEGTRQNIINTLPAIANAPAPEYLDTNFQGYRRDVDPVKLWTGQELADLHNIDYNPDTYYDLIKQGTSAQVNLANYKSALANEASMVDDTAKAVDYLDSIRNTKAESIANGATNGARAAAELLNNTNTITDYANNQAQVAQDRFALVDEALLADAKAKLTARNYFDQLAQHLSTDSGTLYANDTARYGGDVNANAAFYTADQGLRGQREIANASMYADYIAAQAAINGNRNQMVNNALKDFDEYKYVLDKFVDANNGDPTAGRLQFNDYLTNRYNTSVRDPLDYVLQYNNANK